MGESVSIPLKYYDNNLTSTLVLLKVMKEFGVGNFVFSSSATVYGNPASVPIREDFPLSTTNPYGATKLMIERILTDCAHADPEFHPVLRAVPSTRLGRPRDAARSGGGTPSGIPNNFGALYHPDRGRASGRKSTSLAATIPPRWHWRAGLYPCGGPGPGPRAVLPLFETGFTGTKIYNLGTGKGYSVLEMIQAFSKAAGKDIPYVIDPRRPGDIPACYADCTRAYEELGWKAEKTLDDMCADSLRWQRMNPNGFED